MDIGQPIRKITVVPLENPVPHTAPEGPQREPAKEPKRVDTPRRVPA